MSNLSLFGQTLSNVTSFTLPTTGGSTATYTEGGDNVLVVTLSWDDDYFDEDEGAWIPDKTFAEISAAYSAGKEIVICTNAKIGGVQADGIYDDEAVEFYYAVAENDGTAESVTGYIMDGTGIAIAQVDNYSDTSSATISSNSQLLNGIKAVGSDGTVYTGNIPTKTSSDLTASGATVTAPAGYYANAATKTVASGTAGTPIAVKGTVSNHSVSVTPSVTNTTGYITGSTKTGTAANVSASELVSGNLPITQNGNNIDVTNYATVSVDVSGSSGMTVGTATATPATASSSISFTGLQGEPTSFYVVSASNLATGASPYKTASVVFDGTNVIGQYITNTNNAQMTYSSSAFSKSYSNGTLTITGTASNFQANQYKLVYTYGGSSTNIGTESVQVGSGATSITFTGLSDEPTCFACIFTGNIGTSSGYTRAHVVVFDGSSIYGMEMGSGSSATSNWTKSYSSGSLTITSTSTSAGGYFHQPGYYELAYGIGGEINIEIESLTVTQNGTYSESGKAYSPVVVQVSGGGTVSVETKTTTLQAVSQTISFSSLKGTPKYWFLRTTAQISSSSTTYYYIVDIRYNGTNTTGNSFRLGSTRRIYNITSGLSYTYSNGTLTVTAGSSSSSSPGQFYNGEYELVYVY